MVPEEETIKSWLEELLLTHESSINLPLKLVLKPLTFPLVKF